MNVFNESVCSGLALLYMSSRHSISVFMMCLAHHPYRRLPCPERYSLKTTFFKSRKGQYGRPRTHCLCTSVPATFVLFSLLRLSHHCPRWVVGSSSCPSISGLRPCEFWVSELLRYKWMLSCLGIEV